MPNLTFEEAVLQSREFLKWSFGFSGETTAELAAWRYRLCRENEPHAFRASMRESFASAEKFRSSWDELIEMTAECVRSGDTMTPEHQEFLIDVLRGNRKPPKSKPGPKPKFTPRDLAIRQAVHRLAVEGLTPTRTITRGNGPSGEGGSACDAVGAALRWKSYKAVEGIWDSSLTRQLGKPVLEVLKNR